MRRAAAVDDNQRTIVDFCRKVGATVQHLHAVGNGCPDLLIGYRGRDYLVEVKDGEKCASRRRLTPDELEWHRTWRGSTVRIVECLDDMAAVLGAR